MTRASLKRIGIWVPLTCSVAAFALVIANIVAGVRPQPDENTSAHLFQLLIAGQIPFIGLFAATTDNWHYAARLIALQLLAIGLAFLPVWVAGY
jgi:hypothetical protein